MTPDLDDPEALLAADPEGLLRHVASSAAQVREAAVLSAEAGVGDLADDGRPRAVLVLGSGTAGTAGELFVALAGAASRIPLLTSRAEGLPAWAGAADLVVAVSASGQAEDTLPGLEEAVRRGCRLLVVAAAGSPFEELGRRGRGAFVPVTPGRPERAALWSLAVPLLLAGAALGVLRCGEQELTETASVLEQMALRCRPDAELVVNPAKSLAAELADALPVVWGTSPAGGAAARRFASQLHENAGVPAMWGLLPDAAHDQVVVLDGPWAGRVSEQDLFRDRLDEPDRPPLRLVLLREPEEAPLVRRRAAACLQLATDRGVGVSALLAEGASAPARLAGQVCLTDFASTYLALSTGTDPGGSRSVAGREQDARR